MGPHVHNFRVVNRSQERKGNGLKFIERCRCGAMIVSEVNFSLANSKPQVEKSWFDREGNLLRITGSEQSKSKGIVNPDRVSLHGTTEWVNAKQQKSQEDEGMTRQTNIQSEKSQGSNQIYESESTKGEENS